jgi:PTS system nitrogen regulatory IIA component
MELGVRDVARLLNVAEKTIYRWLSQGTIPAYRVNNSYRFNRAELLEWATSKQISVSSELFEEPTTTAATVSSLSDALKSGGIFYRTDGKDKKSAIQAAVEFLRLPEEVDKEFLLQVLLAREAMASTGIGDGIAIPHVRNPIVLHIPQPIVSLCFLEQPIEFDAIDRKPVNCLFTLISPSVRAHLFLLSRLAFCLQDEGFRNAIRNQAAREMIMQELVRVEAGLKGGTADTAGE